LDDHRENQHPSSPKPVAQVATYKQSKRVCKTANHNHETNERWIKLQAPVHSASSQKHCQVGESYVSPKRKDKSKTKQNPNLER
jgi:hypothetical protein